MMERGDEKKKKGKAIRSKERNRLTEGKRERERLNIFLTTFLSLIHYSSIATKRVVAHEL